MEHSRVPINVEPVKEMPATRRSETSASPMAAPGPTTKFATPIGNPASSISRIRKIEDHGVSDAGLRTTVFPNASAGAIFLTGVTTGTVSYTHLRAHETGRN